MCARFLIAVMIVGLLMGLVPGPASAQDRNFDAFSGDRAAKFTLERNQLIPLVVRSWLRGETPEAWASHLARLTQVSLNLGVLTHRPDPLLQTFARFDDLAPPVVVLMQHLEDQGMVLRLESVFEGKRFVVHPHVSVGSSVISDVSPSGSPAAAAFSGGQ